MSIHGKAASVSFENVQKRYGDIVAVSNVSFEVEAGHLVTLLGPSGCGKTTTLRMIAGLEMVSSGRVLIGGQDVTKLPATDRDVSMVFQSYALFPHMTVRENVAYGLTVSGIKKAEAARRADAGLELVGLMGFGSRLPSELSGGQQQRVAVARALVLEPEVLLFDEPLSNLDAKLRRKVREDIRQIQRDIGLTAVYVTHDQEEALAVSDRIIVMNQAVVAQEGTPRDLYEHPADLFVADFIGDANILDAEIVAKDGEIAEVLVREVRMRLPHRNLPVGACKVAIRPEAVSLSVDSGSQGIRGRIQNATYLGNHMEYTIESDIGDLFVVDHRPDASMEKDTAVTVLPSEKGVVLVGI